MGGWRVALAVAITLASALTPAMAMAVEDVTFAMALSLTLPLPLFFNPVLLTQLLEWGARIGHRHSLMVIPQTRAVIEDMVAAAAAATTAGVTILGVIYSGDARVRV
mmetsp:Transcript_52316/g.111417  ORF Transcript_52316/g.111417 Transcript_52316/m.111417 type:complete len:107 (-) Transcript_52316:715-1035(-)